MIYFHNDYSEGCHDKILQRLQQTNMEQTPGYGTDEYCHSAAQKIRALCGDDTLTVHFLVGGTQTNLTVIAAALRPHQGVISARSGHIHVHETGAVEATGHKVLEVPSADGKITAAQVTALVDTHRADDAMEHMVQPKMVYISNPTELGTIYTLEELTALSEACHSRGLYLFMDGARLGYGLTASDNDVTMGDIARLCDVFYIGGTKVGARLGYGLTASDNDVTMGDIARLCDVFYIGGTKVGALFGEAVVIREPAIAEDFLYMIKQRGGMLAKGRLLGLQFDTLLEDGLYFELGKHANALADQLRKTLRQLGYPLLVPTTTNQIFPILPDAVLAELAREFTFTEQERVDETHRAVRFCTSWATKQENMDALCEKLRNITD